MNVRRKTKEGIRVCGDFDDNMYSEILSRLPVKSLLRFKSVSKGWRSLISSDNYFIDLHLSRTKTRSSSSTFMVIVWTTEGNIVASVDLFNRVVPVIRFIFQLNKHEHLLKPVNGLICCYYNDYDFLRPNTGVCIRNVMTQEETPWINTTSEERFQPWPYKQKQTLMHGFGFDNITKEHKVICIWETRAKAWSDGVAAFYVDEIVCKVMTVGRQNYSAWRMIDDFPPYTIEGDGIFVNSSVYWLSRFAIPTSHCMNNKSSPPINYIGSFFQVIVAFNLASEKFRSILIPNFIMDQPDSYGGVEFRLRILYILEVDGHIALTDQVNGQIVKLWIFDEDGGSQEKIAANTTVGSRDGNWIEETIVMPFGPSDMQNYLFESIKDTYQLAIGIGMPMVATALYTLYLYDRKNKTFKQVEISEMPRNIFYSSDQMANFTESLLPVPKIQQKL